MDPCGRGIVEEEMSPRELEAVETLVEFARQMLELYQSWTWGSKKSRTKMTPVSLRRESNYDGEVEEQEPEQRVQATAPGRIQAAVAEDRGRKKSSVPEAGKKESSPTTPLSWSGNERAYGSTSGGGGAAGDRSDAGSQAELHTVSALPGLPCDRRLGHRPALKVEIGDKVHNPSRRRPSKKRTIAELTEQAEELSVEQEEMKKEKKRRLQLLQSLRDENYFLKTQIALFGEKEEAKLPATPQEISSDLAQETEESALLISSLGNAELECSENLDVNSPFVRVMEGTSSIAKFLPSHHVDMDNAGTEDLVMDTKSPSDRFILPDLNVPLQLDDSSDSSSGGCNE